MKIALAQLNYHIGNLESNSQKIINAIRKAKAEKCDIVVFSELSLCGYPPLDLLEQKDFIDEIQKFIPLICAECIGIAAIIGAPSVNDAEKGKKLFNSALFIADGSVQQNTNKTLLPTYDIFDEYRYFEPNTIFQTVTVKKHKVAVTICEDLWDNQPVENSFAKSKLYSVSPMDKLIEQSPEIIINIAASPFSYNQSHNRVQVLRENARKYNLPIVYVNHIGAQTELIFDGGSMVFNPKGEITECLNFFEEDFRILDTDKLRGAKPINVPSVQQTEKIYKALVLGIRDYFSKSGFQKAVLGLSGGIDSAVTLALAVEALGNKNVRVLLMPSKYSSAHSIDDAVALAENLNVHYEIIPIQPSVDAVNQSMSAVLKGTNEDITEENIQARIRGVLLMGISNKFHCILLNTTNKSEAAVGYGTLYGDMNGGLSVLGDVYKTDVYKLADYINRDKEIIPLNTITKPPSAELRPDQKDSDSLPEYDVLDSILFQYIELKSNINDIVNMGFDQALVKKVIRMVNMNEYKRFQAAPILRVSSKAFGTGRRMPIVAKF